MAFRVGQKIVCVNAGVIRPRDAGTRWHDSERIVEGQIYTVRRAFVDHMGEDAVWLVEVQRSVKARLLFGSNIGYSTARFRPVVEKKTDISALTALLNPATHKHLEGV